MRYYHGTAASLKPGDLLEPGREAEFTNSRHGDVVSGHYLGRARRVWFATSIPVAVLYAVEVADVHFGHSDELLCVRQPHVYQVRPIAKHVHRDTHPGLYGPGPDKGACWSGRPARVMDEVLVPATVWREAAELHARMRYRLRETS